ncbi:MAG: M3 family metallopeptidase [Mariprofundales bacterium]|nr:M3 family metallopeptidase [Mariprofundales bacterium]
MVTRMNPLLAWRELPDFTVITPEHVLPALAQALAMQHTMLHQLLDHSDSAPNWERVMAPLSAMDDALDRVWGPVTHLNAVCDSDGLREVYSQGVQQLTAWHAELGQNRELFAAIGRLRASSVAFAQLTKPQQQAVDHALRDFRLAGVELAGDARERMATIRIRLADLATTFEQHLLDATRAFSMHISEQNALVGLPQAIIDAAHQRAVDDGKDGWIFTLDIPSYLPFMQYSACRDLRERLYRSFVTRASDGVLDNTPLIKETLQLRRELAELLGMAHYADYSLATKMATSVDEVRSFLLDLADRARLAAERDWQELQQFARDTLDLDPLEAWDIPFVSERLRQARYQIDQQQLRPWFPQHRVLDGMFGIAQRLYGVQIRPANAPLWHDDARFFEVLDGDGQRIAAFWLDPYARPHKRGGAWMDGCVVRWRNLDGELQVPVAYLVCNFDRPLGDAPALWTHDEVVTLFHEFGHGLHHMLTTIDVRPVSGINGVPWDAVELPSQFMENFCWQSEGLDLISGHVEDDSKLPAAMRQRLLAARDFHSGLQTLRQIEFALFDLELHSEFDVDGSESVDGLLDRVRDRVAVIKPPSFNRFPCSFSHIFAGGYAAGYYCYKWAELLAADAFAAFEEEGVFNRDTAARFHHALLSVGGSCDLMAAFVDFRGRKPTIDALLRHTGLDAS